MAHSTWGRKQIQSPKRCIFYTFQFRTKNRVQKPTNSYSSLVCTLKARAVGRTSRRTPGTSVEHGHSSPQSIPSSDAVSSECVATLLYFVISTAHVITLPVIRCSCCWTIRLKRTINDGLERVLRTGAVPCGSHSPIIRWKKLKNGNIWRDAGVWRSEYTILDISLIRKYLE
jgi:hypothetical protein